MPVMKKIGTSAANDVRVPDITLGPTSTNALVVESCTSDMDE